MPSFLPALVTRARVPDSLEGVTSFGEPEIDPLWVDVNPDGIANAWRAV